MDFELMARAVRSLDLEPETEEHCHRIACYATALGLQLDLGDEDLAALHVGGFLHDVGKAVVPDGVLLKPGPLTAIECQQLQEHVVIGDRLCGALGALATVRQIVRHHHERLDGSGYPDGLRGSQIPMLAQIVAVVDVYDALTSLRPYHTALSPSQAFEHLQLDAARGGLNALLVAEFIALMHEGSTLMRGTALPSLVCAT